MNVPIESRTRLARAAELHRRIAADGERPWWAPLLVAASVPYGAVVRVRNRLFDAGVRRAARVSAPVICVGNLTTGGTGKTPLVVLLATAALRAGKQPAIVTRGYRRGGDRARTSSDEVDVYRRLVPGAKVTVDADRVRGARAAIDGGADLVLLDDGFQHRRLHRDVDLVLVDARDPFGGGRLLPAGSLREPVDAALRRATAVIVTRADRVERAQVDRLVADLRRVRPNLPVWRERHVPIALLDADGNPLGAPHRIAGQRVLVLSGIADPTALAQSIESVGATPIRVLDFGDHHEFTDRELGDVAAEAVRAGASVIVTTEKDLVRIGPWSGAVPLRALRIAAEIGSDADRAEMGRVVGFPV